MKFECHLKVNTPNTFQLEDFHVQIHDRMIFHLRSALCLCLVDTGVSFLILLPFAVVDSSQSPSQKDVFLPGLTACSYSWQHFSQIVFLSLIFFNRFPNFLIMLDGVVQVESHKLGIAPFYSLSLHLPLCLSVCFTLFACLYPSPKFSSCSNYYCIRTQSFSATLTTLPTLFR